MGVQTRHLSKARDKAIQPFPCDGIPRYVVKGSVMAIRLPYGAAYRETFQITGGHMQPGDGPGARPVPVWTHEGIRRILKLNAAYRSHGLAFAKRKAESEQAAAELLSRAAAPGVAP